IPFVPLSPTVMAEGGTSIATAQGYDAFFSNPAGLSRGGGEFMLSSATSWIDARPDQLISQAVRLALGTTTSAATFNFINSQVTNGGFGGGWSYGVGYVRNGFGIGAAFILDSLLYGQTLLGMTGDLTATLGFMGGLSLPFEVRGVKIHVGGEVRPMIRIHAPITNSNAVSLVTALANGGDLAAALNSATAYYGSGIGFDLGAIAELGWFSFGLSVRDLGGTRFLYTSNRFGSVTGSLSRGAFPAGSPASDTYLIPMDIGVGVSFHPDLGSARYFVDPRISADFRNIAGALDGSVVVWTLLHAGVELRLLNMFTLGAGVNQGYLTAGGGVKIVALDLNMAVFTRELGAHLGDRPSSGMTFSADVRI
ncbi:MAG TPA: hypothetical protein VFB30_17590, partial [Spirochaetia bacterium]|nr:hypothetical protein [Spirochaetia bacterium]